MKACVKRTLRKATDSEKMIRKLPTWALYPFIVPSRDVHSMFWIL